MLENNKRVLENANAAVTRGDYEEFLSYCSEDTKWIFIGDRTLEGKDAVRSYMAEAYIEPPEFNVKHLIAEHDFVTAIGIITMKQKDGQLIQYDYCDVWQFQNGKMKELNAFVIQRD